MSNNENVMQAKDLQKVSTASKVTQILVKIGVYAFLAVMALIVHSCGIYSFTGTSIQPDVKTVTINYFEYQALKVDIGSGEGKNWWCVMYPPLCVTEKSEEASEVLKKSLNDETYKVITKKPEVRFKLLELLSQII